MMKEFYLREFPRNYDFLCLHWQVGGNLNVLNLCHWQRQNLSRNTVKGSSGLEIGCKDFMHRNKKKPKE